MPADAARQGRARRLWGEPPPAGGSCRDGASSVAGDARELWQRLRLPCRTRTPAAGGAPSRTRTPASRRLSCCWLRRLCSSTRSPSRSRYCCSLPRDRLCRSSRAPPATLLAALPEVACRAVLCLPDGVLDAAQGRGAAAFNRRRGKKGNGYGRNIERRRCGLTGRRRHNARRRSCTCTQKV